ncbi:arylformamidase [Lysinibacillus louembei]|uniref:Arylformamidase n=1 Tax=Lysinibacillus louembei TaxID=1470088 RepID=A0ABZ0RTF4_9BACI|nr:arylformamidase [Lysinibacillus louembei]WPK10341.1 arylformamidase [Lysinibacillus louembei]
MGWIDITQPLNQNIATWSGDTKFRYETVATKEQTGSVNVGMLQMSLHSGTHMDAPFHFDNDGCTFEHLDLERCIGKVVVVECLDNDFIEVTHVRGKLTGVKAVFFKTKAIANAHIFPEEVPTLTLETVAYLKECGIQLIGVDVPSVDKVASKELPIHHALAKSDIYIVENLLLEYIKAGRYDMIVLPLLIEGADGSPVRAVIKEEQ